MIKNRDQRENIAFATTQRENDSDFEDFSFVSPRNVLLPRVYTYIAQYRGHLSLFVPTIPDKRCKRRCIRVYAMRTLFRDKDHRCDVLVFRYYGIELKNSIAITKFRSNDSFDENAMPFLFARLFFPLFFPCSFATGSIGNAPSNSSRDSWFFASHARMRCRF